MILQLPKIHKSGSSSLVAHQGLEPHRLLYTLAAIYHFIARILGGARGTFGGLLTGLGFSFAPGLLHFGVTIISVVVAIYYSGSQSFPPFFETFLRFADAEGDKTFLHLVGGLWAFLEVELL